MKIRWLRINTVMFSLIIVGNSLVASAVWALTVSAQEDSNEKSVYVQRAASRDGIGKFYMGREISRTMGHRAARWLERPGRVIEEKPDEVVAELGLKPSDIVADVGAGSGYFTFRLSRLVPQGLVLAVDIQPEMLRMIEKRARANAIDNIKTIQGSIDDPKLPKSTVDVALMVDAYHEFSHPREMMQGIIEALKPGGRVVLIEYRGEDPRIPIKPLHKMTETQVKKEMRSMGLRWRETKNFLPAQHFMVFEKPT